MRSLSAERRSSNWKLLVLDLDGTIIDGSAGVLLAEELNARGLFENWDLYASKQYLFGDPGINQYDEAIRTLTGIYAQGVRGLPMEQMTRAVENLTERLVVRDSFANFLKKIRGIGFRVFLTTSSPMEAASPILERYSFDGVLALTLLKHNGLYTGDVRVPITTKVKRDFVDQLLAGNPPFSCGIGDTASDMRAYGALDLKMLMRTRASKGRLGRGPAEISDFGQALEVLKRDWSLSSLRGPD